MPRVTSKRPSNFVWSGGVIRPDQTVTVPDEIAALLNPDEFIIHPDDDTPKPSVQTRPAKRSRTRKKE